MSKWKGDTHMTKQDTKEQVKKRNLPTEKLTKAQLIEFIQLLYQEMDERESTYMAFEKEYEKMLEQKNQEVLRLKGKVMSQDITLASYKEKVGIPIISAGEEQDIYYGEQKDFIINLLKNQLPNYSKNTRGYHILESIIKANPEVGIRRQMMDRAYDILKNYTSFKEMPKMQQDFNSINMVIERCDGGSHFRIRFKDDDRYFVVVSCTPSDNRTGKNCASNISKTLF